MILTTLQINLQCARALFPFTPRRRRPAYLKLPLRDWCLHFLFFFPLFFFLSSNHELDSTVFSPIFRHNHAHTPYMSFVSFSIFSWIYLNQDFYFVFCTMFSLVVAVASVLLSCISIAWMCLVVTLFLDNGFVSHFFAPVEICGDSIMNTMIFAMIIRPSSDINVNSLHYCAVLFPILRCFLFVFVSIFHK